MNALLNFCAIVARQNGIDLTLQIALPDALPIPDMDLCNMAGNILENAMVACRKAQGRIIRLTLLAEDDARLYIVAANSFDGNVRQRDGRYLSTNRNGNGIGPSSVAGTAEAHGGVAHFSHQGSWFYSSVAIPIGRRSPA